MADTAWLMRTYSGHSTARDSNALYRKNLDKGQTGLSVAFDLPTQTGYDPDAPESAGEVGKVGVPVAHLGHMHELMDGIPLDRMNTSMTINATAAWLLGLYVTEARNRGLDPAVLTGTTQNDIIKEYLSRGTYIFAPEQSRRLTVDTIVWALRNVPRWNPINVCSYHLQEAGATPEQELAFALASAVSVLDAVKASGQVSSGDIPKLVGRISFFCNSGIRFVEEVCKMRAFSTMWDQICEQRYEVTDPKMRRFRHGVQVNSLGLTEQQPENNVTRIVLETLGVTLSADARARDPAASMERSARAAPTLGSAVVPADTTDPRVRDRPSRTRGHLRRLARRRSSHRRACPQSTIGAGRDHRPGRVLRSYRRAQGPLGSLPVAASSTDRIRRAGRRRGQPVHYQRDVSSRR